MEWTVAPEVLVIEGVIMESMHQTEAIVNIEVFAILLFALHWLDPLIKSLSFAALRLLSYSESLNQWISKIDWLLIWHPSLTILFVICAFGCSILQPSVIVLWQLTDNTRLFGRLGHWACLDLLKYQFYSYSCSYLFWLYILSLIKCCISMAHFEIRNRWKIRLFRSEIDKHFKVDGKNQNLMKKQNKMFMKKSLNVDEK